MSATWNARLAKWPYFKTRIMPAIRDFGTCGSFGPLPEGLVTDAVVAEFHGVKDAIREQLTKLKNDWERRSLKGPNGKVWDLDIDPAPPWLPYPMNRGVGNITSLFLYAWTRKYQPHLVIESGVANGVSSSFILAAMVKNGYGSLVSVEVNDDTGVLVRPEYKERWTRVVIPQNNKRAFDDAFYCHATAHGGAPSMFFHDSFHSYEWQMYEYETAHRYNTKFIASDDSQDNFAFVHFAQRLGATLNRSARFVMDDTRVLGIIEAR